MARITVNTTGTQPSILITSNVTVSGNQYTPNFVGTPGVTDILVPQLQDVTVTNSTGVYSYTTFSDTDKRKISTPADNTISCALVIDDTTWFGNVGNVVTSNAMSQGLQYLSSNKVLVGFRMFYNDSTANVTGSKYKQGVGFITNLAPKVTPDAPVWVTPCEIAVDGTYTNAVK